MHRTQGEPAQNKANFPKRGTEAVSAMAAVGSPNIPVFHHSSIPVPCRSCETKPNFGAPGVSGSPARGRQPIVQNKANFGRSMIGAKPFSRKELCRIYPSHRLGKTKPILTAMPIRRSAFPGALRAKRSQFGRAGGDRVPPSPAPRGCCTNKANFAGAPRNGRGLLPFRCQSFKTKPICPGEVSGEDTHPTKSRG